MVIMTACGGASAGFSSQNNLARAYAEYNFRSMQIPLVLAGHGPSERDAMRFVYGSDNAIIEESLKLFDLVHQMQREKHDAMMNGTFAASYNAEGVRVPITETQRNDYRRAFENARRTANSFTITSVERNAALTTAFAATAISEDAFGLATNFEVWVVTYSYTPFTGEQVAGTPVTGLTMPVEMFRIGGRWYTEFFDFSNLLGGGGNDGSGYYNGD
jgi:hypothetical protein